MNESANYCAQQKPAIDQTSTMPTNKSNQLVTQGNDRTTRFM